MKFEFEINEQDWFEADDINDFKQIVVDKAIRTLVDKIVCYGTFNDVINEEIRAIIKNDKDEIIDKVIDRVANTIIEKKEIQAQMPKKSEMNNISKEWQKYFEEIAEKAVKAKFKSLVG